LCDAARACDDDFGDLILVLATKGCRFDQAARLTVVDLQQPQRGVMGPTSAKGRGKKQTTHTAVPICDEVMKRLARLAAGCPGHEAMLILNLIDWNLRRAKLAERPHGHRRRSCVAKRAEARAGD